MNNNISIMNSNRRKNRTLALSKVWKDILFCIITLSITTCIAFIFVRLMPDSLVNIALIYILGMVIISRYTTGYIYGIITSVLCVIFINYCFTFPYFELNFTLSGYPLTFLVMLSISLITCATTSHIMEQSKILAQREKQLAEAEKEKMRANLLRAISHDLRTPLTSIIGALDSYIDKPQAFTREEINTLLHTINDDANWLLTMVENLLSVTRIQNDISTLKKTPEILEEVISEAVSRLKKRYPEAAVNITIPDEFLMIPMDAMLIEQVIINLLENALVHSGSKRAIDFLVDSDEEKVFFHIRDYGIGIDEEKISSIFEGIPSTDSHTADSKKGMGIGLSICKTIILAHQGEISAIKHPDGAEFTFCLPREEIAS